MKAACLYVYFILDKTFTFDSTIRLVQQTRCQHFYLQVLYTSLHITYFISHTMFTQYFRYRLLQNSSSCKEI